MSGGSGGVCVLSKDMCPCCAGVSLLRATLAADSPGFDLGTLWVLSSDPNHL